MPRNLTVFLSSPGDVRAERDLADNLLTALERSPAWRGKFTFQIVRWDDKNAPMPMDARLSPQQAIDQKLPLPSSSDIVIVVLWARMGTPIASPLKEDGTPYQSGTEWEFADALRGKGNLLVFRRLDKPQVDLDLDDESAADRKAQYDKVKAFFATFVGPDQSIKRGTNDYTGLEAFSPLFEQCIEGVLRSLDERPLDTTVPVPPELLRSVCSKLETVGGYKDIHDQLHELENQCYDCLVRNVDHLDQEAQRWDEILVHVDTLLEIAGRIREYALKLQQYPQGRVALLQACFDLWQDGASRRDVNPLKECKKKMAALLALQPGLVVAELNRAASILMPEMIRLSELRKAAAGEDHNRELGAHVAEHDTWQRLRDLLHSPTVETLEADAWWPEVEALSDSILELSTDGRDAGFRAALEKLKKAMAEPTAQSVREGLLRLRHQTKLAFHRADTDLKNLLDDLRHQKDGPCGAMRAP